MSNTITTGTDTKLTFEQLITEHQQFKGELSKCRRKLEIAVRALELLFDNISCDSSAYRDTVINDALKEIEEMNNE